MSSTEPATPIADFAGVLARIEARFDPGQVERVCPRCIRLSSRGAELAILAPGGTLPTSFDVALVVGAGEDLAAALDELGGERVQLLPLPAAPVLVDQILGAALGSARQHRRANMVDELLDVGAALVAERDPARVLELILTKARQLAGADAGSIYVVEGPAEAASASKSLRFRFAENASISSTELAEFTLPISEASVVGACVLREESINLADLYSDDPADHSAHGRTFVHDRSFDARLGYQTRSMLTVPMRPPDGLVLGVIQLINALRDPNDLRPLATAADFERRVVPFEDDAERLCQALAAQGAVALENARLYAEIEALFEAFVRASVQAIEMRDPTTSGHSERVSILTLGLAEVVDRCDHGPLAPIRFDRASMRELEYAALLHDFGKVSVREEVLVKAKKLHPLQHARVMARFDHMRTAARLHVLTRHLAGDDPGLAALDHDELEREMQLALARVEALQSLVEIADEPSVLGGDRSESVQTLAQASFVDGVGRRIALLEPDELEALKIARGSLTDAERQEIQSHVVHTFNFLRQIPWSRKLARVPEIAGKHHLYLDGSGYPQDRELLTGPLAGPLPVQTRMMTIADIFDALVAADRPYKKAVPRERALDILEMEVRAGKLDADLFALFVEGQVFRLIEAAHDGR